MRRVCIVVIASMLASINGLLVPFVDVQIIYSSVELEDAVEQARVIGVFDNQQLLELMAEKNPSPSLSTSDINGRVIQRALFPMTRLNTIRMLARIVLIGNAISFGAIAIVSIRSCGRQRSNVG